MPEESRDRLLSQPDFFSGDPQSVDVLISGSSHTADAKDRNMRLLRIAAKSSMIYEVGGGKKKVN